MIPTPQQVTTEINADPVALGYAGKSLPEKHALLNNSQLRTRPISVDCKAVASPYLIESGAWERLEVALVGATLNATQKSRVRTFFVRIQTVPAVNPNKAEIVAFMDNLVTLTVLTQAQVDGWKALGIEKISRAEELWQQSLGLGYLARCLLPARFAAAEDLLTQRRILLQQAEEAIALLEQGVE